MLPILSAPSEPVDGQLKLHLDVLGDGAHDFVGLGG